MKRYAGTRMNDIQEIMYFAYFHIARIIWGLSVSKRISSKTIIKNLENGKILELDKMYDFAINLLNSILVEHRKSETIDSVGHFFSRQGIDEEITRKLQKI